MTFHTEVLTDLLGLDEGKQPSLEGGVQTASPTPDASFRTSLPYTGSAGPSSGRELASSQTGTEGSVSRSGRQGKRKTAEKPQSTFPQSVILPYGSLAQRAALALKAREPCFVVDNIPANCERALHSSAAESPRT